MPVKALPPDAEDIRRNTYPAPPNPIGGPDPVFTTPLGEREKRLMARVQRSIFGGNHHNVLSRPAITLCDWVIEEEIPKIGDIPNNFLEYPTRRCFLEDEIQMRVQLHHVELDPGSAHVEFRLERVGTILDDPAMRIANIPDASGKSWWESSQRTLQGVPDIDAVAGKDSRDRIVLQVQKDDGSGRGVAISWLATTVRLPAPPGDFDTDGATFRFRARISQNGRMYEAKSPELRAVRWWAAPKENIRQPKSQVTVREPLVDGQAYFNECCRMIEGASQSIFIANWTMWIDTYLTDQPAMTGKRLRDLLRKKADQGVQVYIMLGEALNGANTIQMMKSHLMEYSGAGDVSDFGSYIQKGPSLIHRNIHYKIHHHPFKIQIGALHVDKGIGSFHEKYLIVDGKEAAVGGIDFQPNRSQAPTHDWKIDTEAYNILSAQALIGNAGPETSKEDLIQVGSATSWGITGPSGQAGFNLPAHLPPYSRRAVLATCRPHKVGLGRYAAGSKLRYLMFAPAQTPYYALYENGIQTAGDWVPEDRGIDLTFAAEGDKELVWWDTAKPDALTDLDFTKGAHQNRIVAFDGASCDRALWMIYVPCPKRATFNIETGEGMRWHDAAVYVEGPVVTNLAHDFTRRWNLAGDDLGGFEPGTLSGENCKHTLDQPAIQQPDDARLHNAQVVKTADWGPTGCRFKGHMDIYRQAIQEARHYIYIENQYFCYPELGEVLQEALEKNPRLQLIVSVPFSTEEAAKVANSHFKNETLGRFVLRAIKDKIKPDPSNPFDLDEFYRRGILHQQFLTRQLIDGLRKVTDADKRVGIYMLASVLKDHSQPRSINKVITNSAGLPASELGWAFFQDGAIKTTGRTGADGKVSFTIPANAKSAYLVAFDPFDASPDLNDDVSSLLPGTPQEHTYVDDDGNPWKNGFWALRTYRWNAQAPGIADENGDVTFRLPADAFQARMAIYEAHTAELSVGFTDGTNHGVLLDALKQPLADTYWALLVDNHYVLSGQSDASGAITFDMPPGHDACLISWPAVPDRYDPLPLSQSGTDETITLMDAAGTSPIPFAYYHIDLMEFRVSDAGFTDSLGKAHFTIPNDSAAAELCAWGAPYAQETYSCGGGEQVYPHSKLMIVDDTWAIVGSANANGKSFVTDEEISVAIHDRDYATKLRKMLFKEHIGEEIETRQIRGFFDIWNRKSLKTVDDPSECDPAQLTQVHAVKLGNPPPGQKYDGPLSTLIDMDKQA